MSITTETTRIAFVGDGSDNSPYAISFPLRETTSVEVIYVTDSTGVEVVKTITTDYTIAVAADFTSATLTLVTTAPATGETMLIRRNEPATRLSNIKLSDGDPSATRNSDADKGTMEDQTLQEQLDRALVVAKGHPNADLPLTPLNMIGNAGLHIAVNATEDDWALAAGTALTGSGTLNTIPLWTPDGNTLGDSSMTQSGTAITVGGTLTATGQVTVPDGSAAAPGLRLTSEAHGLFRVDLVALGFATAGVEAMSIRSNGLTVVGSISSGGSVIATNVVAATDIFIHSINNDTDPSSDSFLRVATGSAAAGDPFILWEIQPATQRYVMGIDNSDSDSLVISRGAAIGTTNVVEITSAGFVSLRSSISLLEQAAANPQVAGFGQYWVRTAAPNEPWFDGDTGVERQLLQGTGGTVTDEAVMVYDGTTGGVVKEVAATITVAGLITAASDADGTHTLGVMRTGTPISDQMHIAHFDHLAIGTYALRQIGTTGEVHLNTVSGQLLNLSVANSPEVTISGTAVTIGTNDLTVSAGTITAGGPVVLGASGVNKIWTKFIRASDMALPVSNPAVAAVYENGEAIINVLDFDQTTSEFAGIIIDIGTDYDASALSVSAEWTASAGTTGDVRWNFEAAIVDDDEALGAAAGNNTIESTFSATNDLHDDPLSLTPTGAATGHLLYIRLRRDASNAADTFDADARLIGVRISY